MGRIDGFEPLESPEEEEEQVFLAFSGSGKRRGFPSLGPEVEVEGVWLCPAGQSGASPALFQWPQYRPSQ